MPLFTVPSAAATDTQTAIRHAMFYRPGALSDAQPTVEAYQSNEGRAAEFHKLSAIMLNLKTAVIIRAETK